MKNPTSGAGCLVQKTQISPPVSVDAPSGGGIGETLSGATLEVQVLPEGPVGPEGMLCVMGAYWEEKPSRWGTRKPGTVKTEGGQEGVQEHHPSLGRSQATHGET